MVRIGKFILGVLCFLLVVCGFLYTVDSVYSNKIGDRYYDGIGDIYANVEKNQGLVLQESSLKRQDNLFIFGSSELGSMQRPFHPSYFFEGKKDGFQINMIGRGYSQSIIHAINAGALKEDLRGKKAVLIVSPQWFTKSGLQPEMFNMNISELQFYSFMFNKKLDKSLKLKAAQSIKKLAGENQEFGHIKTYCDLYTADNIFSKAALTIMMPYYNFEYYVLSIKDKIKTDKVLNDYTGKTEVTSPSKTTFDWVKEREKAVEAGKREANNNEYLIENSYYDMYIKDKLDTYKGSYKKESYLKSPEYDDLKLLLEIYKSYGMKVLVVSVPVHGKWYDYCDFDKNDRVQYYKNINSIVTSYGFQVADFSEYEYEDYFLKDIMHLGWKGWVYADEAIDKFYNNN